MTIDWAYASDTPIAFYNFLDWSPGAAPVLAFRRLAMGAPQPFAMDMVAEVDGPAKNALIWQRVPGQSPADPGCYPRIDSMAQGKWVLSIEGENANGSASASNHKGVIGGPVDQLHPPVLAHLTDGKAHSWYASKDWVGDAVEPDGRLEVAPWPWQGQSALFVGSAATDPEHLTAGNLTISGKAAFWEALSLYNGGINVWTQAQGSVPFIRWLNDYTKIAGGFGTDGTDMVWSYGQKQAPSDPSFVGSIMTAPFTTDPQAVQARRLRSFNNKIGAYAWSVGCGYAANTWGIGSIVVRLADGVSWMLPGTSTMMFNDPIGVTCDEVFILGRYGGLWNIARVRLDSLGPGTAPD
jgi:hypothetical protein